MWAGTAIRHIPATSPFDVLDTRFAGLAADNRWNEPGEPTFYLAGDLAVALAEYARHLRLDVGTSGAPPVHDRAVYEVDVRLEALLDLRDPQVRSAMGLHGGVRRFLDRGTAQATAHFIRRTTAAQGLLVPSIAFLDDPTRWNLVVFLEKLPADTTAYMPATFYRTVRISD
jgi:RES domain-containing protein